PQSHTTKGSNAMKRVLIIEDDPLLGDVYRDKLTHEGFAVDVAVDGNSGLAKFWDRPAHLVLLDLMLPKVSGVDVIKAIRSQFRPEDLPVVVLTNSYLGGMVQSAWEAGASQVLNKASIASRLVVEIVE